MGGGTVVLTCCSSVFRPAKQPARLEVRANTKAAYSLVLYVRETSTLQPPFWGGHFGAAIFTCVPYVPTDNEGCRARSRRAHCAFARGFTGPPARTLAYPCIYALISWKLSSAKLTREPLSCCCCCCCLILTLQAPILCINPHHGTATAVSIFYYSWRERSFFFERSLLQQSNVFSHLSRGYFRSPNSLLRKTNNSRSRTKKGQNRVIAAG